MSTPKVEVQSRAHGDCRPTPGRPGTRSLAGTKSATSTEFPWSLQTSFYPMNFITQGATRLLMAEDIEEGAVRYLVTALGLSQIGYRDWITARTCDTVEQGFFRIPHDSTVVRDLPHGF